MSEIASNKAFEGYIKKYKATVRRFIAVQNPGTDFMIDVGTITWRIEYSVQRLHPVDGRE
jgi:hypothetical protein